MTPTCTAWTVSLQCLCTCGRVHVCVYPAPRPSAPVYAWLYFLQPTLPPLLPLRPPHAPAATTGNVKWSYSGAQGNVRATPVVRGCTPPRASPPPSRSPYTRAYMCLCPVPGARCPVPCCGPPTPSPAPALARTHTHAACTHALPFLWGGGGGQLVFGPAFKCVPPLPGPPTTPLPPHTGGRGQRAVLCQR